MANPYRWGDVTPARALELKRRREYRASQLFSGLKARRGEAFDLERASTTCRFLESDRDVTVPSGKYIPKDMLATIHEGEAVWPKLWADSSGLSGKSPAQDPGHAPSGSGEA
jgi:hypothetical protein